MQNELNLRIVGKTVILTVGKEVLKANMEKEQKDILRQHIEKYNKKPSEFWMKKITKMFEASKKELDVKSKASKKLEKKEVKTNKKVVKKAVKEGKIAKKVSETVGSIVEGVRSNKELEEENARLKQQLSVKETVQSAPSQGYARKGEY